MIQTAKDKHLPDDRQLIGLGELFFYHVAGLPCGAGLQRQQHIVSFEMRDCSSSLKKIVFEGPVLGPAKDRDWTGPGQERTGKLKDR